MKNRKCIIVKLLLLVSLLKVTHTNAQEDKLPAQMDKMGNFYVSKPENAGLIIALITPASTYIKGYGTVSREKQAVPDTTTLFEIGSITKVFTTALFASLAEKGLVGYEDLAEKHLPEEAILNDSIKGKITLKHLAAHMSGLPALPEEWLQEMDSCNPYKDLTRQKLYEYLSKARLEEEPGKKSSYSNLGMGLLGHILETKTSTSLEALFTSGICDRLGMYNTVVHLSPAQAMHMAEGHDESGKKTCNWDIPVLTGAGALRSNAADMIKFLRANMNTSGDSLGRAFEVCHLAVADVAPGVRVGLGWHTLDLMGKEVVWHNGGTGGYRSFIGFNKEKQTGIVVLSNSTGSVDELAVSLLFAALTTK